MIVFLLLLSIVIKEAPASSCKNLSTEAEWQKTIKKIAAFQHTKSKAKYGTTKKKFLAEIESAKKQGLNKFSAVKEYKFLYRFDLRNPLKILKDGGFWPNPKKPKGSIVDHTAQESTGTQNYVSVTTNPNAAFYQKFFSKQIISSPEYVVENGEFEGFHVIHLYEYRLRGAEGTRVTGGMHPEENEVIIRGLPLNDGIDARRVSIYVLPDLVTYHTSPHYYSPQVTKMSPKSWDKNKRVAIKKSSWVKLNE